ncbi:phosphoglycerate mutase-like protein [Delitschia confertaspora ATCC 74209]|uniref:Phosphoglycerate mutase-like protein n=1 Tax=Delitschia confertaspora ATCC 74209 TaxID=1513339 RepID=A0A9P4MWU6_9PLEO|nr:phosphoglycerate mutase-like protein [Delitschia confertaspora ATCC 74209]
MGRPRMIILIRHAQSEGNKNRDIHQFIPDHRVKLTTDGWGQAEEAGRRLRSMLKPDDTLQFFTSPYRRTRETTEGILRTLTSDDPSPSPFPRHAIKVFEEPRLREQDFGNFQPCSAEMERMWQERADYGHFFYRIPNGESAADAYDRISGFNESMWRQFGEPDFPSVCVLVTHGLMTRVFLMKWYHWSVEYFEDLRNVNHCEFIVMKHNPTNGKYILENELRTWSDLRRRAAASNPSPTQAITTPNRGTSSSTTHHNNISSSPTIPVRRWGGCVNGCNHDKINYPRRITRKNTADFMGGQQNQQLPAPAISSSKSADNEKPDHPLGTQDDEHAPAAHIDPTSSPSKLSRKPSTNKGSAALKSGLVSTMPFTPASPNDASNSSEDEQGDKDAPTSDDEEQEEEAAASIPPSYQHPTPRPTSLLKQIHPRKDIAGVTATGEGGASGEGFSDDSDYFPGMRDLRQHHHPHEHHHNHSHNHANSHNTSSPAKATGSRGSRMRVSPKNRQPSRSRDRKTGGLSRKMSKKEWVAESGMGSGALADTLGDGEGDDVSALKGTSVNSVKEESEENVDECQDVEGPILKEALKGDMMVQKVEAERGDNGDEGIEVLVAQELVIEEGDVEKLKKEERRGFGEVY